MVAASDKWMERLAVLETEAITAEKHIVEIKLEVKALRRDLSEVRLTAAESRGTTAGIGMGAKLAYGSIWAAGGAGLIKAFEWFKGSGP